MTKAQILTEISNRLPENFENLDDPQLMLHFVMKAATEFFEADGGLKGNWILLNGDLTLLEMMKESKDVKTG